MDSVLCAFPSSKMLFLQGAPMVARLGSIGEMKLKLALSLTAASAVMTAGAFAQSADMPPSADPGECFARVLIPETTEVVAERVVDQPDRTEIRVIPATYETVTEQVLVREETTEYRVVPATYETVTEQVIVQPERTETSVIPAVFETVTKQVVATPPSVEQFVIPAEYDTVTVRRLVTAKSEETITIPATYKTVEKRVVTGGGGLEWREVLCDTNAAPAKIAEVQRALTAAGYQAPADGSFGPQTLRAMEAFQRDNGLPVGYLTVSTVRALGVEPF